METEPNWQDVSGHYSLLLKAPPAPAPGATLTFRTADQGSTPNAPKPTLTQEGDAVRVTFDVNSDAATKPRLVMAYTFFAGWNNVPPASLPTHLHVSLDKLEIHRSMDAPDCRTTNTICASESIRQNQQSLCVPPCPGQWNLYWDVNGIWGQWGRSDKDPAVQGELDVKDGDVLTGNQGVDLYVSPGQGWRFFVVTRECDLGAIGPLHTTPGDLADCPNDRDLADDNDVPGLVLDQYPSAQASLGTHRSNGKTHKDDPTSSCPDPPINPDGCYSITYSVSQVNDAAIRTRTGLAVPNTKPSPPFAVIAFGLVGLALALFLRLRTKPVS
jgi:hypothetical protein